MTLLVFQMMKVFDVQLNFPKEGLTTTCKIESLGNSAFRLLEHPLLNIAVKYGDIIEADVESPNQLKFIRLRKVSDLKMLDYIFSKETINSKAFKEILKVLNKRDIFWQRDFGGLFICFVRPSELKEIDGLFMTLRDRKT